MHEYILNDVAQVYSRKSDELEMIKCDVCGKLSPLSRTF